MATSERTTFNLDLSDIMEEAYDLCGSELRSGYDYRGAKRALNLIFLEWQNKGLNLWKIEQASQTLTAGTSSYSTEQSALEIIDAFIRTDSGDTTKQFDEDTGSLLTGATSFGTAIAYSKNLFVISEPETTADPLGTSTLRIYTLNDSVLSDDITLLQTFTSANGSGTSLAISEDQNYIFAGNPLDNNVDVYNRQLPIP